MLWFFYSVSGWSPPERGRFEKSRTIVLFCCSIPPGNITISANIEIDDIFVCLNNCSINDLKNSFLELGKSKHRGNKISTSYSENYTATLWFFTSHRLTFKCTGVRGSEYPARKRSVMDFELSSDSDDTALRETSIFFDVYATKRKRWLLFLSSHYSGQVRFQALGNFDVL